VSRRQTSFVLGYHGCEKQIAEKILLGDAFKLSEKDFDWLGPGAYFWEGDPVRADEWATHRDPPRDFKEPYVIGAVIDLRNCLDLTTREGIAALSFSYRSFEAGQRKGRLAMPVNEDMKFGRQGDKLLRRLDCAVIQHLHKNIDDGLDVWIAGGRIGPMPPERFDTVRGMFPEGEQAYEGAGFQTHTHTQIAVRTPDCIVGVFRVR